MKTVPCVFPRCPGRARAERPVCAGHWRRLPEDVRERLRSVFEDATTWEYEAAVRSAEAILEDYRR